MSGHNKWSQIKHRKGAADQKKGRVFSKLSRLITLAARKGEDPESNLELKGVLEQARAANMPKESIERAIKKVSDKETNQLEELIIEALGPVGLNLIMIAITDNRNRTMAEIKKILSDHQAKIGQPGSVLWAFDKKGREFTPKYPLALEKEDDREQIEKLLNTLDDHEDIQEIYSNY